MSLSAQNLAFFCKLTSSSGQVVSAANPCWLFGSNTCLFCLREAFLSFRPHPYSSFRVPIAFCSPFEIFIKGTCGSDFLPSCFSPCDFKLHERIQSNLALLWAHAGVVFFSSEIGDFQQNSSFLFGWITQLSYSWRGVGTCLWWAFSNEFCSTCIIKIQFGEAPITFEMCLTWGNFSSFHSTRFSQFYPKLSSAKYVRSFICFAFLRFFFSFVPKHVCSVVLCWVEADLMPTSPRSCLVTILFHFFV